MEGVDVERAAAPPLDCSDSVDVVGEGLDGWDNSIDRSLDGTYAGEEEEEEEEGEHPLGDVSSSSFMKENEDGDDQDNDADYKDRTKMEEDAEREQEPESEMILGGINDDVFDSDSDPAASLARAEAEREESIRELKAAVDRFNATSGRIGEKVLALNEALRTTENKLSSVYVPFKAALYDHMVREKRC